MSRIRTARILKSIFRFNRRDQDQNQVQVQMSKSQTQGDHRLGLHFDSSLFVPWTKVSIFMTLNFEYFSDEDYSVISKATKLRY